MTNIEPWHTLSQFGTSSDVPCPVLTIASWPAYRFLKRQVRWSDIPISFRIFQFIVIHRVIDFGVLNKAEVDVYLELSCRFGDPTDVDNLISSFSPFSKSNLNIWKFMVHILLKPGLENFEHYFTSVWDECNYQLAGGNKKVRSRSSDWTHFIGLAFGNGTWILVKEQALVLSTLSVGTSLVAHMVNNPSINAGDRGLISGSGRSPGEGNGNPVQDACLENPTDRGSCCDTVHGVGQSWTWPGN